MPSSRFVINNCGLTTGNGSNIKHCLPIVSAWNTDIHVGYVAGSRGAMVLPTYVSSVSMTERRAVVRLYLRCGSAGFREHGHAGRAPFTAQVPNPKHLQYTSGCIRSLLLELAAARLTKHTYKYMLLGSISRCLSTSPIRIRPSINVPSQSCAKRVTFHL